MKHQYFINKMAIGLAVVIMIACAGPSQYEINKQSESFREIGEAYMRQGNFTAALAELLKAEKLTPDDHILQNDLGFCYLGKNRLDLSVLHLKRAIELKPDYAPAKNSLGVVYLKQRNWKKAIATFKEITDNLLYATPHYPLSNLGEAYFNLGDLDQAEYYFMEALKRKPNFHNALRGLGQTYLKKNRPKDAIYYFEKALETAPNSAPIYFDLANAYQRVQDQKRSIHAYEKVLELAPNSTIAKRSELALYHIRGKRR
jgi:type IV pilus assembly protein PilF